MDPPVSERVPTDATAAMSTGRALMVAVVAVSLIAAVTVVVAKTVSTSSARVAASTSTDGLLTAGTVVLERADDSTSLFLEADDLYPGLVVAGCIVLDYAGSVPAALRLHGDPGAGTGLDAYVDLQLSTLSGDACPTEAELVEQPAERELYQGRLSGLWRAHATYATGIDVTPSIEPGDRLVVRAVAVVVDDNRAAGLTTDFVLTIEGRPS